MVVGRVKFVILLLSVGLACTVPPLLADKKDKDKEKDKPPSGASSHMSDQRRALHALNRLTFGPRPGDVQRVMAIGVDKWIDEQLHPEKISDIATESRLAPLRTLRMDTREIVESFPPPQIIKEVEQGRRPMPSDPVKRAIYEDQIERIQEKQALKETAAALPDKSNSDTASGEKVSNNDKLEDDAMARRREDRQDANLKADQLLELPPDQRMREILKMSPEERHSLANSIKGPKREEFFDGMNAQQRET